MDLSVSVCVCVSVFLAVRLSVSLSICMFILFPQLFLNENKKNLKLTLVDIDICHRMESLRKCVLHDLDINFQHQTFEVAFLSKLSLEECKHYYITVVVR